MPIGVVGRKEGMTRIFTEEGQSIPVTVVHVEVNRVTQIRSMETDGYRAYQITTGSRRAKRVNKPASGHYAKANSSAGRGLWEFRLAEGEGDDLQVGGELKAGVFEAGQIIDATGTSIGKGFAGVIKRYHFQMQDATHGNSLSHRAPGSIGQNQSPGHVFKGKKMAGHMGNARRTIQNLEVVRVDEENGVILIKGAVPGAKGSDVILRPAVKKRGKRIGV
jgi:large subunit ribosomal protein L3